ncbi:hypothetical protein E8E13_000201 [Curvularia kusanoi]|uniref:Uncharacterized protein n=1 Tax=Curvularia kusanoi TaxID=90978 RepID=A0A9P4T6K2_CURKU|nr:hypothetical protein E8E13_000201 [Curvularia kusanoi]
MVAEPDEHIQSFRVNCTHALHLVTSLSDVTLINAYGIDPKGIVKATLCPMMHFLQKVVQICANTQISTIDQNGVLERKRAPLVRDAVVLGRQGSVPDVQSETTLIRSTGKHS